MNLILFSSEEIFRPLPPEDRRNHHIRTVLRRHVGESFDCGLINGPRGKAVIRSHHSAGMVLEFAWQSTPPPAPLIDILIGLPRPPTVRKILVEATSIGVGRLIFFASERSEPAYAQSSLWTGDEVRRHLIAGAEQAFCTHLPEVSLLRNLTEAIQAAAGAGTLLALDNYEASTALSAATVSSSRTALAVGAERGWSADERTLLRDSRFTLAHLGARVLRTETATCIGLALIREKMGLL